MAQGISRRHFLGTAAVAATAATLGGRALAGATTGPALLPAKAAPLPGPPFTLGVASGDPLSDGVVLWTRLAPDPTNGGGMPDRRVRVRWQLANDDAFTRIVRRGTVSTTADVAHSVHVDVRGLDPDRVYYYRFFSDDGQESPAGRTRTAPARNASPKELRFAFGSCQNYQDGYFTAHRALAAEDLALFLFLGDYIYESGPASDGVRVHGSPEPMDLAAYRNRYGQYKQDDDLQAAHAAMPWAVIWDDHEVENNYAGAVSQDRVPTAEFLARRAAAYRAWWEHMPVRMPAPTGPDLRIYRTLDYGRAARFYLLDGRQYRSDQPCNTAVDFGTPCPDFASPEHTMLGAAQERWLDRSLRSSQARWNVLGNQVLLGRVNFLPSNTDGGVYNYDQWDGYGAARERLLRSVARSKAANPFVVTGDIHSSWVNDVYRDPADPETKVIATEVGGTSITSSGDPRLDALVAAGRDANPSIKYYEGTKHGYVRVLLRPTGARTDFRYVDSTSVPSSRVRTGARFAVAAGTPGARQVD